LPQAIKTSSFEVFLQRVEERHLTTVEVPTAIADFPFEMLLGIANATLDHEKWE
jgi:hypothetical protein